MARTTVPRPSNTAGMPSSYGIMLDFNKVQTLMDKLDEHDAALDTAVPSGVTSALETVTSGNLSTGIQTSFLSVTGTVAYTLPDGTFSGQTKDVECSVAATTPLGTLTITTPSGSEPSTHVFTAVGQRLHMLWTGTGWHLVRKIRAGQQAVTVGTTVTTGLDMASSYALSVTGTVHSTGSTKKIPNGVMPGETIHIMTPTAASTPLGDIDITATTIATGVAATSLAAINATTAQASFVWDGATWQNTSLTTATLS